MGGDTSLKGDGRNRSSWAGESEFDEAFRKTRRCNSGRLDVSVPSLEVVRAIVGAVLLAVEGRGEPLLWDEADEATDVGRPKDEGVNVGGDGRGGMRCCEVSGWDVEVTGESLWCSNGGGVLCASG